MRLTIEQFLESVLNIDITVVSHKGWARACCPIHGETRPSFGVLTNYPYVAKCFACGYHGNLCDLTARVLGISFKKASELIADKLELELRFDGLRTKPVGPKYVPSVILELYASDFNRSRLCKKYLKFRGVPLWVARSLNIGYDVLGQAMVVPMLNVYSYRVQDFFRTVFAGTFDEAVSIKCEDAGSMISTSVGFTACSTCVVVEGVIDGAKIMEFICGSNIPLLKQATPVILHTAFASNDQINFIRRFDSIIIALDHDDTGERGTLHLLNKLRGKSHVFTLEYPESIGDPGELSSDSPVYIKLAY